MSTPEVETLETLVLNNWKKFEYINNLSKTYYNTGGWELDSAIHHVAQFPTTATVFDIIEEEDLFDFRVDEFFITFVELLTQLRLDISGVSDREDNILHFDTEGAEWRVGYNKALALHVISHGKPARWGDGYYGWVDSQFAETNPGKYVVAVLKVKTDSWDEFEDTFSGSSHHTGVVADCVFSDGSQRRMRWEGEASDLIRAVTS